MSITVGPLSCGPLLLYFGAECLVERIARSLGQVVFIAWAIAR